MPRNPRILGEVQASNAKLIFPGTFFNFNRFGFRVGFQSTETPKIRSAVWVGFRSMEKPSFVRPFGWASEVWKNQVSIGCSKERENSKIRSGVLPCSEEWENSKIRSGVLPCSEERENSKIRSGVLPCSEEWENSKIRSGGLPCSEERENSKDSIWIGWASEKRKPKDSIGWASEERKLKDSIGWASEKRKSKDKDSCGGLPTNENPKIKIRSGGFRLSKERKKLKIRSVSSEEWKKPRFVVQILIQWAFEEQRKTKIRFGIFRKVEPRFVLTNLGLVSRVGSDKQKKTKDS
ncbi:hypothetical protein GLOIN_2v1779851 [Rhizophagus irregularis DAOM 181602=DAOM 197198]|nr:hypothetical protein GLOIN_2v1779851 [Rhizophagus irregularis DAOM 181602=DAOM 197198]